MANERRIHDSIWTDAYFQDLTPEGKLLFIYLITNEHIEVSGVYQLTVRTITNETGLPTATAEAIMAKLAADNKIIYEDNIVGIVNYHKHNSLINNPKYQVAIRKSIAKFGLAIQDEYCHRLGIDWVSIGNQDQSPNTNTKVKIKTNINTKVNTKAIDNATTTAAIAKLNKATVRDDGRSEWAKGVWLSDKEWDNLCEDYGDTEVWECCGIAEAQYLTDDKPKNAPYVRAIAKRRKEESDGKSRKRA